MLTGALPAAESQLIVDRSFVLRHLGKGFGAEVLDTTLLADQLRRQADAICDKAAREAAPPLPEGAAPRIERYMELDASVKGSDNQFIRLSAKQQKEAEKEMKAKLKDWKKKEAALNKASNILKQMEKAAAK